MDERGIALAPNHLGPERRLATRVNKINNALEGAIGRNPLLVYLVWDDTRFGYAVPGKYESLRSFGVVRFYCQPSAARTRRHGQLDPHVDALLCFDYLGSLNDRTRA